LKNKASKKPGHLAGPLASMFEDSAAESKS